jgi:hypothetical protein
MDSGTIPWIPREYRSWWLNFGLFALQMCNQLFLAKHDDLLACELWLSYSTFVFLLLSYSAMTSTICGACRRFYWDPSDTFHTHTVCCIRYRILHHLVHVQHSTHMHSLWSH